MAENSDQGDGRLAVAIPEETAAADGSQTGSERRRQVRGNVDHLGIERVSGWAWDPTLPDARLTVWIEVNGSIVGTAVADTHRDDLVGAGIGDGRHGFNVSLPGTGPREGDRFRCLVSGPTFSILLGRLAKPAPVVRSSGPLASPVFIVGSPRSGTTVLAGALRRAGYFGFNEGHLLNLLAPIGGLVERHFAHHSLSDGGQLLSHIDRQVVIETLSRALAKVQSRFNARDPWFDKTPDVSMIHSSNMLARLWPGSTFVFAKRRAIENIVSRIKKFPDNSFEAHCASWSDTMAAWRKVRDSGIRAIEIDQYDIARDPADTAAQLGAFLGLTDESVQLMASEMAEAHPQRSDEGSTRRVLTMDSCGWTEAEVAIFRNTCAGEMEAYGYTLDERYRIEASAPERGPSGVRDFGKV